MHAPEYPYPVVSMVFFRRNDKTLPAVKQNSDNISKILQYLKLDCLDGNGELQKGDNA